MQSCSARGHQDTTIQDKGLRPFLEKPRVCGYTVLLEGTAPAGFTPSAVQHTCLFLPAQALPGFAEIHEESAALCFLQKHQKRASQAREPACSPPRQPPLPLRKATITKLPPDDRQERLSLIGSFQLCNIQRMTKREDRGNDKDPIKKNSNVDLRKIKIQD